MIVFWIILEIVSLLGMVGGLWLDVPFENTTGLGIMAIYAAVQVNRCKE